MISVYAAQESEMNQAISVMATDPELALEFLATFARFEYALKRTGTYLDGVEGGDATPAWDRFANAISARFAGVVDAEFREAIEYLRVKPPQKQVRNANGLGWRRFDVDEGALSILLAVRRVRNNLFHGGKFTDGPVNEVARDRSLLAHSLCILRRCSQLDDEVRSYFAAE